MEFVAKSFDIESCPLSQEIKRLTPESPEEDIRSAFIRWNKEVLGPMIDDIIPVLEKAYVPYGEMMLIPDMETANAKNYIRIAIGALKVQRAVYCEIIDSISSLTTLSQFLTFVCSISPDVCGGCEISSVAYGMGDAKIGNRWHYELEPALRFRNEEALRVSEYNIDTSYSQLLREEFGKYEMQRAILDLEKLSDNEEQNAEILYRYFDDVFHPIFCEMIHIEEELETSAEWWRVFDETEISPNQANPPSYQILLDGLTGLKDAVLLYLDRLPETAKAHSKYETVRDRLLECVNKLEPYVLKLQTARKAKKVTHDKDSR